MFPFELEELEELEEIEVKKEIVEYEIDFQTGQLTRKLVKGLEAVKTWVWMALQTARYRYQIYSWNYGNELENVLGTSYSQEYLESELQFLIKDCIFENEHIKEIKEFQCIKENDAIRISFFVVTEYGEGEITTIV